jgi:hypothetical protein
MDGRWVWVFNFLSFLVFYSGLYIYALGAWGTEEWDIISSYSGLTSFR